MIAVFKSAYNRIYLMWHNGEKHTPNFLDVTDFSHSFSDVREVEYITNSGICEIDEEVEITVTAQMVLTQNCDNNANENDITVDSFFGYIKDYLKTLSLKDKVAFLQDVFTIDTLQNHFEEQKDLTQFLIDYSKCLYSLTEKDSHCL